MTSNEAVNVAPTNHPSPVSWSSTVGSGNEKKELATELLMPALLTVCIVSI